MRHLQEGELARGIARDQLRRRALVTLGHMHLAAGGGDVMIGEEMARGTDEKAGAGAGEPMLGFTLAAALALAPRRRHHRLGGFGMPRAERLLGGRQLRLRELRLNPREARLVLLLVRIFGVA